MKTTNISPATNLFKGIACLIFALVSISMAAQAPPSADTFVTRANPAANYGSAPILAVQEGTTTYVQFDLSSLPEGTSISKATMRLYVNSVLTPGMFDVYQVNDSWSESTLNNNNAPPLGASATGGNPINISASSLSQFIVVDITPLVQGWASGATPNNGVALALAGSPTANLGSFSFDSKENTLSGHQPELAIVLDAGCPASPGDEASKPLCIKNRNTACCSCVTSDHRFVCTTVPLIRPTSLEGLRDCQAYCLRNYGNNNAAYLKNYKCNQ